MSRMWAVIISGLLIVSGLWILTDYSEHENPIISEDGNDEPELLPDGPGSDIPIEPTSNSGRRGTRGGSVQRVVLAEDFTNWACGPCGSHNPAWTAAIEAKGYDEVAPAYIHVNWPWADDPIDIYGSMPTHANNRRNYYGVSGVPSPWVDGVYVPFGQTAAFYEGKFDDAASIPARISIATSGYIDAIGLSGSLNAHIEAVDKLPQGDYRVMVYLWENNITRDYLATVPNPDEWYGPGTSHNGYPNGESEFDWAVWLMLPDEQGQAIWQSGADPGDYIEISLSFSIEPDWVVSELGATIFVQNFDNREVMQAHVEQFKNPAVTLISPERELAEQELSDNISIDWLAQDTKDVDATLDIRIDYSIDGGKSWTPIMFSASNSPPYSWDTVASGVPDDFDYWVRVTATDSDGRSGSGILSRSIEFFTIDNYPDDRWYLQAESINLGPHLDLDMKPAEQTLWDGWDLVLGPPEVSLDVTGPGEYPVQTFASKYVALGDTDIAGDWDFSVYARASNCTPTVDGQLYAKVYADDGVTQTPLFTTGYDDEFIGSYITYHNFFWTHYVPEEMSISAGNRIVVEIMLHATAGTSTAVYRNYARSDIPIDGTVANDFTYTHSSNDQDETITEEVNYVRRFIEEDFSSEVFPPAKWTQTGPSNQWSKSETNYAGGISPEARFSYAGAVNTWRLYYGPMDTTGETSLDLMWDNFIDDWGLEGIKVTCKTQTSQDASSWTDTGWSWTSGTGNLGPGPITETITTADVGSSTLYVSFTVDGYAYDLDYWFIDNIVLIPTGTGQCSLLEHKWLLKVPTSNDPYGFTLEASRPNSADGDDFVFAYSTNDITYIDMATVNMIADNTYTYPLPAGLPEDIYIRVKDTDRTAGNNAISSIDIDEMFINSTAPSQLIIEFDHYTTPSFVEPSWGIPAPPTNVLATLVGSNNIKVSWTLSLDDGTEIDRYEIYRGMSYDPTGFGYIFIDQVAAGTSSYMDLGVGDGDWNDYFYYVRSVNTAGNYTNSCTQAGKFVNYLDVIDHNMISVPLDMSNTNREEVLKTVNNSYTDVYCYDATYREWVHWNTQKDALGWGNSLTTLDQKQGIWISVISSDHLVVAGRVLQFTDIELKAGWNFVGYPSLTTRDVGTGSGEAFETISGFVNIVQYYNASGFLQPWEEWDVGSYTQDNLIKIEPGFGLWIHVTGDCTWRVNL